MSHRKAYLNTRPEYYIPAKHSSQTSSDHSTSWLSCCSADTGDAEANLMFSQRQMRPLQRKYKNQFETPSKSWFDTKRGNWLDDDVEKFTSSKKRQADPIRGGSPNEKYKWILMKYDMERDNRISQAE